MNANLNYCFNVIHIYLLSLYLSCFTEKLQAIGHSVHIVERNVAALLSDAKGPSISFWQKRTNVTIGSSTLLINTLSYGIYISIREKR